MGLDTLDETKPAGTDPVSQGDDAIRETRAATKQSFGIEHALNGYHRFRSGPASSRPAAGHSGDLYINTDQNVIEYDTGTVWVKTGAIVVPGSVDGSILAPNSVDSSKIVDGSIMRQDIHDREIVNSKIALGNITTDLIYPGSITQTLLGERCVQTHNIELGNSLNGPPIFAPATAITAATAPLAETTIATLTKSNVRSFMFTMGFACGEIAAAGSSVSALINLYVRDGVNGQVFKASQQLNVAPAQVGTWSLWGFGNILQAGPYRLTIEVAGNGIFYLQSGQFAIIEPA